MISYFLYKRKFSLRRTQNMFFLKYIYSSFVHSISRYGAQQLHFDVMHFLTCFENEEIELSLDSIAEIHSLPVVSQMKNAIILLACQPEGRNNRNEDHNLLTNYHGGSSSSTISQVSIGIKKMLSTRFNIIIFKFFYFYWC